VASCHFVQQWHWRELRGLISLLKMTYIADSSQAAATFVVQPEMLTLTLTLHAEPHAPQLALAVAKPEWLGLVSNFTRMPPVERTRVGHSIQAATQHNPFPENGTAFSPAEEQACDSFVSDCVLLAALAEATSMRVLEGTAVATYKVQAGNAIKARLN
jgi:hypothetical protein